MAQNTLLEQVKRAVREYAEQQEGPSGSFDPDGLITKLEAVFQQHESAAKSEPAGMDPYGGLPDESGSSMVNSYETDGHSGPRD